MATFGGSCEPLHGHNYDVMIELEGELTDDSWVWDFGAVKRAARTITEDLDHHFLLQRNSKHMEMWESADSWTVSYKGKSYTFPASDVYPLPIENTTAECISEWFAGKLLAGLVYCRDVKPPRYRGGFVGSGGRPCNSTGTKRSTTSCRKR
jgi:6-pyruvoyltetrahydropterin/6-carboxytetrahydropterin synthase